MRKMLGVLLTFILVLVLCQSSFGASSAVQSLKCSDGKTICCLTIDWTAHTDGSFTSVALNYLNALGDSWLYEVETDPGSPAPAAYDVTLVRTNTGFSYDVLGGRGASRSATVTGAFLPTNESGSRFVPVGKGDTWTLGISGATNSGAKGVIRLWFSR
jgi:hypothetical protein